MLQGILGKKIGMTQIFDKKRQVIPVTAICVGRLFITQVKEQEKDGYVSAQVGLANKKMSDMPFSFEWLKKKKNYFEVLKEIDVANDAVGSLIVGQEVGIDQVGLDVGSIVAVSGRTCGKGFQGVVKRWNFKGGPKSHGSTFHRAPGSVGNMCSQGKVIKGKKLPGHDGNRRITVKGLRIVGIDNKSRCVFVRGSVPGKKNSLLMLRKQG